MKKAKIILIVGGCCVGKSTLARMLATNLEDVQCFADTISNESYRKLLIHGQSLVIPVTHHRAQELLSDLQPETLTIILDAFDHVLEERVRTKHQLSLEAAQHKLKDIRTIRDWSLRTQRLRAQETVFIDTGVNNPDQVLSISREFLEAA